MRPAVFGLYSIPMLAALAACESDFNVQPADVQ